MKSLTLNTEEASTKAFARFAVLDERRRSSDAKTFYSQAQLTSALRVSDLLDYAYNYKNKYINYRKTFIAIKLDNPRVLDKAMLDAVEELFAEQGYTKAVSPQGIIYRMPRIKK